MEQQQGDRLWGSPYVISPLLSAWKGRKMSGFFRRKMKATPCGQMRCFPYFSIAWTNISGKQTWFGKVTLLRILQSYILAKPVFIFLFHFLHLKQGEGIVPLSCCIKQMGLEVYGLVEEEAASCLLSVEDKGAFSLHGSFWKNPWILVLVRVGGERDFPGVDCILYTDKWSRELVILLWQYLGRRAIVDYLGR